LFEGRPGAAPRRGRFQIGFSKKIGGVVKCFWRIPAELLPVVQITVPFEQSDGQPREIRVADPRP
jgi:hypothetical protein